ncbi:MAG: ABC transporter permease [Candidatus Synoicihabitans palmerolidicus]|nr:ABC transporter permease [Candidatus Synoicihabitans palmerolidicus]
MSVVLTLLRKDIRLFLRNKTAFALTFIVPLVLVYIFGQVFGVSRSGGSGPSGIPIAVVSETGAGLLQKVIFSSAPEALMDGLRKRAVNFIGADATNTFYSNMATTIADSFGLDPTDVKADMTAGNLVLGPTESADATLASDDSSHGTDFINELVKFENEQLAGADVKSPDATRVGSGWAIMFLLFSVSGASTALFEEKQAGIFQRLLASPVHRNHVLWSKYLFNVLLGLVQLTVLFLAGQAMFGIETISHLPELLVVALVASIACTAFGMMLSAISSSPAAASGLATFLILTMSAMGGAWFPTSMMPEFIQSLSKLTLVYWAMEGFLAVLWSQQSILEILPILEVLLGIAAVVNTFSLWRFNQGNLFA